MSNLLIGLMSGTSLDGIDIALVDFEDHAAKLIASLYIPLSSELKHQIIALRHKSENEIEKLAELDVQLGKTYAAAINQLLAKENIQPHSIQAIGSHGQTIRHYPDHPSPFTIQLGDPNIIAAETGITTVADFRRRDLALGGQGAPLVPAFHQFLFGNSEPCAVVNIGGIANITVLQNNRVMGFDSGPGNTLIDTWIEQHLHQSYDKHGEWAASGKIQVELLDRLLNDPYFKRTPPKSTGQEYFNLHWLQAYLTTHSYDPVDVQATLTELTAITIVNAVNSLLSTGEIFICGGGVHNHYLLSRIQAHAKSFSVSSTEKKGIPPDWIEAMAFAWLAKQTLEKKPGNVKAVTGARSQSILGGVYFA